MERRDLPTSLRDTPDVPYVILSVSPLAEDHVIVKAVFDSALWRIYEAESCEASLRILSTTPVAAIITNDCLPDGDWLRVLAYAHSQPCPPHVIVASRLADDQLWAKVLNHGGYDLLVKPFDPSEVRRIVSQVCAPAQPPERAQPGHAQAARATAAA